MRYKGITYDTGTEYSPGNFTVDNLSAERISSDMIAIKNRLYCNSIRIYGKDIDKLIQAADIALQTGLDVWLSPRLIGAGIGETIMHVADTASRFEQLRVKYAGRDLVLVIAGEATIDIKGLVKGDTIYERIKNLMKPLFFIKNALGIKPAFQQKFDLFLRDAASAARQKFGGKITYAGAMWEKVNWQGLDFVAVNLYKAGFNERFFEKNLKKLFASGKPVAITEFGCCCYDGADKKGPAGYFVLDSSKTPPVFKEPCVRNEEVQASYITDLLKLYKAYRVEGTFVFDFHMPKYLHNSNPEHDYDMAGFAVTKTIDGENWAPKKSFDAIAGFYKSD